MGEAIGSEHAARLAGDIAVVIAGTLWSVLVFSVVAALAIGALNAIRGTHTSIKSVVGRVALIGLLVAGAINVSADLLHRPKGPPYQALSMAEFVCILISPLLLASWGLAAMVRRARRPRGGDPGGQAGQRSACGAAEQRDAADEGRLEAYGSIVVCKIIVSEGKVVRPSQLIASVGPTRSMA